MTAILMMRYRSLSSEILGASFFLMSVVSFCLHNLHNDDDDDDDDDDDAR